MHSITEKIMTKKDEEKAFSFIVSRRPPREEREEVEGS
jgi:hypothetical protein